MADYDLLYKDYPGLDDQGKKTIESILDGLAEKMKVKTDNYIVDVQEYQKEGIDVKMAGPVVLGYPWWNILVYGPYQPIGGLVGPHKNMQADSFAFIAGLLWMNPFGINFGPGPTAAQVMGAFDMQINFETINLSTFNAGPAIPPVTMSPIGASFSLPGFPWLKPFFRLLGPGVFPVPPSGRPHKYELHVTADVNGPVPQPFFAGYSTWMFDPDWEPAIWPPPVRPPAPPHWHFDVPCQFLVYQA